MAEGVRLDLNNPTFQRNLFALQKADLLAALKTFAKLSRMTWSQVYADNGLKWERINGVASPVGAAAIYSMRITQARRATATRDGEFMRLLTIAPDHDAAYGRK